MLTFNESNAFELPRLLFPNVDFDTAMGRFYETQNQIAIAVSEYRYNHELSQAALAEKLGVSQAMVSKYESGSYNISLKAAYELFDKLGMRFICKIEDDGISPKLRTMSIEEAFSCIEPENECSILNQGTDELQIA